MASFMDIIKMESADEVDELVALLRNSQLPTVLVENYSDVRIYSRWAERRLFGTYKVDVLAVGGKVNLLSVHERRNEFVDLPVVFIANRDMRVFSGIPESYKDIIYTHGYSIENDIYSISGIEHLLDPVKASEHWIVRESVIKWFAFEVEEFLAGGLPGAPPSLDELVPAGNTELDNVFCEHRGFHLAGSHVTEKVSRGHPYQFNLPGKLLFQILARFSTVSLDGLYNAALTNYESVPGKLIQEIKDKLDKQRFGYSQDVSSDRKTQKLIPSVHWIRDSVKNFEKKTKRINTPCYSANDLINQLKIHSPTVIVEREVDSRFDWWVNQLDERLRSRKMNQVGMAPKILSIIGKDEFLSAYERQYLRQKKLNK